MTTYGECQWNYIIWDDEVVGANPAALILFLTGRSSVVEHEVSLKLVADFSISFSREIHEIRENKSLNLSRF